MRGDEFERNVLDVDHNEIVEGAYNFLRVEGWYREMIM